MVLNFIFETFMLGLKSIRAHKLRSVLTTLGIILGVAAVIIMVAIGEGAKQAALDQLRQLGARNILLRSVPPPESPDAASRTQRVLMYGIKRRPDMKNIKAQFRFGDPNDPDLQGLPYDPKSALSYVVPLRDSQLKVAVGDTRITANAIGTVPEIFEVINLTLERGRIFNHVDIGQGNMVCVLGSTAAQQMFPYQDPLGQRITVGDASNGILFLEVVGVLEKTGLRPGTGIINREIDRDVYFPQSLVTSDSINKRTAGSEERKHIEITEVWLQARNVEEVETIASIVDNVLAASHPVKDYEIKVPIEILRNAERLNRMFNFIIVVIASISLVVGGIGIMNIMLATVTERTKEIGIRRALGAKQSHITLQFLVETTVVSLTGGLIGIGLGCAGAIVLPILVDYLSQQSYPTKIASWSVLGSFIISGLIGVGFGLYPAVTAARMNPIEALRHE